MTELNDYSGPFKPDLTFNDFSKEFLLKLMTVWQYAWLHMDLAWFDVVKERFGFEAACECDLEAWLRIAERVNPRYPKIANIQLNTVLDSLKCLQLPLDNVTGGIFAPEYDIKNENHVIVTIKRCKTLEALERDMPEMIVPLCQVFEPQIIQKYVINPKVKVTATKLPPRESPDDIACRWEYKLEM